MMQYKVILTFGGLIIRAELAWLAEVAQFAKDFSISVKHNNWPAQLAWIAVSCRIAPYRRILANQAEKPLMLT